MDWWQTLIILLFIGLVSIGVGMLAGIPLSNVFLRRREQISTGKYRTSPKFEPQYNSTDQFDKSINKHGVLELKTEEQDSEETVERENDEVEVVVGQVEPVVIERLLLELEKNHELAIKSKPDQLVPFQTDTWDASPDVANMLTGNLKRELTQAYLDMSVANDLVWFLEELDIKRPLFDAHYTKMCDRISTSLSKVIPVLKNR